MRRWNPLYNNTPETSHSFYTNNITHNPLHREATGFLDEDNDDGDINFQFEFEFDQDFPISSMVQSSLEMMDEIMRPRLFNRRRSHYIPRRVVQRVLADNMYDSSLRLEAVREDTIRYMENMHVYEMAHLMTQFVEDEIISELSDFILDEIILERESPSTTTCPKLTSEDMERLYPTCKQGKQGKQASKWCTVCHENITENADVRVLGCKHSYHMDCIDEWCKINASCPVCRGRIGEEEEEEA